MSLHSAQAFPQTYVGISSGERLLVPRGFQEASGTIGPLFTSQASWSERINGQDENHRVKEKLFILKL